MHQQATLVLRRLLRAPLFGLLTLLTLALGIGANTAIFSIVRGVLLKPLPYTDPDRLIGVWLTAPGINIKELNSSPSTYFTFREENKTLVDVGMWSGGSASVTGLGDPEQVDVVYLTDAVLPLLGVNAVAGRRFSAADDRPNSPDTVMLTYGYWQRRFGGEASALGRRIMVDGRAREIVGVLPQSFRFMNSNPVLVIPLQPDRTKTFIGNFSYQAVARLKPGVSLEQANADVARMLPLLYEKFPPAPGATRKMFEATRMAPNLRPLSQDVIGDIGNVLWILMGTAGIVLFIACANVANLLLVRAGGRQHELAIRAALGAGTGAIARELLFESIALGLLGGALGIGVARAALALLLFLKPANFPRLNDITIDLPVLLFALIVSLVSGILFGLVPVFKYAGPRLNHTLHSGGRTASEGRERHRARSALVVVQVSLAIVLLTGSGLMIRSFLAIRSVQPGFIRPEQVLTLRVGIPPAVTADPEQVVRTQREMVARLRAIPGVESVALTNSIPMSGNNSNDPIQPEDRPYPEGTIPPIRRFKFISPGYFQTLGNRIVAGRDLTWTDITDKRNVLMVSENLAREIWGSPSAAIGKRVRESSTSPWREIVGIAGDEHDNGADRKAPTIVYWPLLVAKMWGQPLQIRRSGAFAIRSSRTGSEALLKEVREAIWAVQRDLPIANVRTLQETYDRSMARTSFTLVMLGIASGIALVLGLVGIYGVISYSVTQRTREIGIRIALGAEQRAVRTMFVRYGLRLAAIGVTCGLIAAFGLTRLMTSLLYGVKPSDPTTFVAVASLLALATLTASYIPARRATSVDPVEALRAE